jgi:hypothetical protein
MIAPEASVRLALSARDALVAACVPRAVLSHGPARVCVAVPSIAGATASRHIGA